MLGIYDNIGERVIYKVNEMICEVVQVFYEVIGSFTLSLQKFQQVII